MARAGDDLKFERFGVSFVFLATTEETNGELLRYEACFRPRGILTKEHVHPHQAERHELVSGNLALSVDGAVRPLVPGEAVDVPAGVPHALVARDDAPMCLRVELRPALRWETVFETAAQLAAGPMRVWRGRGYPNPLLLAMFASEYEPEIHATRPPLAVQRMVLRPLAVIAERMGYRERYLEPSRAR
jgi:quercetin dioxygenase-like cupin family protein